MVIRRSLSERVFGVFNVFLMLLIIIATLYPFIYVAFSSVSRPAQLIQHQGILLRPLGFTLSSYRAVFRNPMILLGYINTLFVLTVGTTINMIMTILMAFVLSRRKLMLRNAIMFFMVFTMYFSGGLIPLFFVVNYLGLVDTRWALIIPSAMSTFNIIIMRTAFMSIPDSLEESAHIDGANAFTILIRIILPLSIPTIVVILLFYAVGHWNAWFSAMIYLRSRELFPLQLILREILVLNDTNVMFATAEGAGADQEPIGETIRYATVMVATIPILFVYPFLQKHFVKGVMIGALKE